jgi:hypothetical protein
MNLHPFNNAFFEQAEDCIAPGKDDEALVRC